MTRSSGAALPMAGVSLLTLAMLGVAVIAGAASPSDSARADGLALDIPPAYLAAYQAASRSASPSAPTAGHTSPPSVRSKRITDGRARRASTRGRT